MSVIPRFGSIVLIAVIVIGCAPAAPPVPPPAAQSAAPGGHEHDADDEKDDADHDHEHADHEEPKTVAEGLAQLEKLCADTRAHLAAGDYGKADGPVHMIGHLLEDVGELVAKERPAAEADAKLAMDAIFECFDKLDTGLHAADAEVRKKLDYAEHAPAIEAAIAKLKDLFPAAVVDDR